MKKIISFLLLLALCLSLTACGGAAQATEPATEEAVCAHQWTEADCENPSACALCGEVQSEALGHDWTAATCLDPEFCTRCAQTRGGTVAHSYGTWLLDAETMYHTCAFCDQTETAEIDYPLFLSQNITGRWNFYKSDRYGRTPPSTFRDEEIRFCEDGRVIRRSFDEEVLSESWSFDHAEYDSEHNKHLIYITAPDGSVFKNAHFSAMKEDIFFILEQDDGDRHTLERIRSEAMASALYGTWSTCTDGSLYSITLSEDRTFTGDFDGEVTGYWLPRAPQPNDPYSSFAVMLHYRKDGAETVLHAPLSSYNADLPLDWLRNQMTLSFYNHNRWESFSLASKELLAEVLSTAESELLGTWTSTDFTVTTYYGATIHDRTQESGLSTDYSITLNKDGTFRAQLHEEMLEGTWKLGSVSIQSGYTQLSCDLTAEGIEDASFTITVGLNTHLSVDKSRGSSHYTFRRMTDEEIAAYNELLEAAPTRVVGNWISAGAEAVEATFLEDGTFTILSGTGDSQTELKGKYHFDSVNISNDNSRYYYYDIEITTTLSQMLGDQAGMSVGSLPGFDTNMAESEVTISEEYALILSIRDDSKTLQIQSSVMECTLISEENAATKNDAVKKLLGHWSADNAFRTDADVQEGTPVPGSYSIDFAEDGTFTCRTGKDYSGTWEFSEVGDDFLRFTLTFDHDSPGMSFYCYLNRDGLLVFVDSLSITFTR